MNNYSCNHCNLLKVKAESKKHSDIFGGGDGYDDKYDDYNGSEYRYFYMNTFLNICSLQGDLHIYS